MTCFNMQTPTNKSARVQLMNLPHFKMILYSYNLKCICRPHSVKPPQTHHFISQDCVFGNKSLGELYARICQFDLLVHRLGSLWSSSNGAALEPCLDLDSLDCLKEFFVKCQSPVTIHFAQLFGQQQWGPKGRYTSFWQQKKLMPFMENKVNSLIECDPLALKFRWKRKHQWGQDEAKLHMRIIFFIE